MSNEAKVYSAAIQDMAAAQWQLVQILRTKTIPTTPEMKTIRNITAYSLIDRTRDEEI